MPSGRTHDSITLWSLPLVAALTFERTQSSSQTLMVAGGYLFSGLMFGPDLDIYSRQYQRWGVLRWIWLPYRRAMRHRSLISHGPIIGTVVRLLYLMVWLGMFGMGILLLGTMATQFMGQVDQWQPLAGQIVEDVVLAGRRSLQQNSSEWLALVIGLELGGLSHALSDWTEFAYKRLIAKRLPKPNRQANRRSSGSEVPICNQSASLDLPFSNRPNSYVSPSTSPIPPTPSTPSVSPEARRRIDLPNFKDYFKHRRDR